jgi:hypothetical protein
MMVLVIRTLSTAVVTCNGLSLNFSLNKVHLIQSGFYKISVNCLKICFSISVTKVIELLQKTGFENKVKLRGAQIPDSEGWGQE